MKYQQIAILNEKYKFEVLTHKGAYDTKNTF